MKIKLNIWLTLSLFFVSASLILMVFNILYASLQEELLSRTHDQLKSVNILKKKLLDQFLVDKYEEASHIIDYYQTHATNKHDLTERLSAIKDVIKIKYQDLGVDDSAKHFYADYKKEASHFNFYFNIDTAWVELMFGFETVENILQERTGLGSTGESYLVSEGSKLMTSSYFFPDKDPSSIICETLGVRKAFRGIQDVEIYPDYRGISIIGSYRLLEFNGIRAALLTEIDHEEAMEPIIQIRNELLVLLVILLVFLLIISAGFAQILSRPIFKLKNISRQLSRGELPSSLPSSGFIFELSEITKSFHQLIDSLKQTVSFAEKIGKGEMDESYVPLSEKDELGLAIVQMRDQLVKLDKEKNALELQAKKILIDTQEKERERIARDLHDGLGTILTTMKLRMENTGVLDGKPENELKKLLEKAIMETRFLARNLMPSVLMDFGLNEALSQLINDIRGTTSIEIKFVNELEQSRVQLDKTIRVGIYRIVQEAVTNTIKHSNCSKIILSITVFDDHLVLFIKDDGVGFNQEKQKNLGLGLKNMKERSKTMNGELILESGPDGTSIEVIIPL